MIRHAEGLTAGFWVFVRGMLFVVRSLRQCQASTALILVVAVGVASMVLFIGCADVNTQSRSRMKLRDRFTLVGCNKRADS